MRRIYISAGEGLVVVVFQPTGAAHFFERPLHELLSGMANLAELTSRARIDRLQTRLAEAGTDAARAALVDAYLCSRLVERAGDRWSPQPPRPFAMHAAAWSGFAQRRPRAEHGST